MATPKKKARTKAPTRSLPETPTPSPDARPNTETRKFITRTIHTIVTVSEAHLARPMAGMLSITIRSHEPGESVACRFTVDGTCNTGARGITVSLSYLDPATMTTVPIASGSTSCVGGSWSYTFDLNGSGLPAGTELFVDAQIDRINPTDPLINAYMNLYTATACPIIAKAGNEKK